MKDLEKKIRRYNLMHIHRGLVKDGKYAIAKNILWLLVNGSVKLGLGDTDWETEKVLEKKGGLWYSKRATQVNSVVSMRTVFTFGKNVFSTFSCSYGDYGNLCGASRSYAFFGA